MKNEKFIGTGVALITPFKKNFEVDYASLKKLIHFNIENGINYFVSLGTTGESATLSPAEKNEAWKFTAKTVSGKVPLVAGIGGNNTAEVAREMKAFNINGYDAFLSVSPYYNKPSQEGIFQHYLKLADASSLPIILYNVPSRTGSNITAETTVRLAKANKKFIGIKEASGNLAQVSRIIKEKPEDFLVISGDDVLTVPIMSLDGDGVISVTAQAFPLSFSRMVDLMAHDELKGVDFYQSKLLNFMEWFFHESSPAGVKAALHATGFCENVVRLPLVPVSKELYQKIEKGISEMKREEKKQQPK